MINRLIKKINFFLINRRNSLKPLKIKVMEREEFLHLNEYSVMNTDIDLFPKNKIYIETRPIFNEKVNGHTESYFYARIEKGRLRYRGYNYFLSKTLKTSKLERDSIIVMFYYSTYKKAMKALYKNRFSVARLLVSAHINTNIKFEDLYVCVYFNDFMICGIPNINTISPFDEIMYRVQYSNHYANYDEHEIKL